MIKKIISGGQTGADQGALEAAVKLDIAHGGWIPKGRRTESGPLPAKYKMQEMPGSGYAERTEKNVTASDGTLLLSHGRLTEGSEYTRKMAVKHGRPWLHIDLVKIPPFRAATMIVAWINEHNIEVLNVAGPRASKDPKIQSATQSILTSVYYLSLMQSPASGAAPRKSNDGSATPPPPQTVGQAVELLTSRLPLKDRAIIANMTASELGNLDAAIGGYLLDQFGLDGENKHLLQSCRFLSGKRSIRPQDAKRLIIGELWRKLRLTHRLRIIK